MRDGWRQVALGDVVTRRSDFVPVDGETLYPIAGVQRSGWGITVREPVRGDSMKFSKLMRLSRDDLVYRTITAFEAPSAVVGPDEDGAFVTPQTFPVFSIDKSQVLPAYMALHTQFPGFHREMSERCTGTVLRRKTLAAGAFTSIPIALPPLEEQRRIVDLIGALDGAITAVREAQAGAEDLLSAHLSSGPLSETVKLGERATIRSGPSWKAADESPRAVEGSISVLGITNTPAGRLLDLSTQKFVAGLPASVMKLDANSLIMVRTNGNRHRIGNVYRASADVFGYAVSAFQFLIQPSDTADQGLLYWALSVPEVQALISESASGSTGLGNVAAGWLKTLPLPCLNDSTAKWVERAEAIDQVVATHGDVVESLTALHAELLSALLSGEHEIPGSYDELVERAGDAAA